ncbi:hypothetical protein [Arthrobacter sp. M4]|uniref:hypothetical protein n=1 Tax=Arthrobacter sp. M4 TaxID=218160 RepID=UPI001CDB610B|nr:hypothetical protein [Arthrobacter sp. M4]MCA4132967.1 hypothetical protein [Arthrobacter sp. M4]
MFHEIRNVSRTFNNLGVNLPAESANALELADAILESTTESAGAALNQSIIDGETTIKNIADKLRETALAMLIAERIPQAAHATQDAVNRAFFAGIRNNADDLVKALRTPFDKAAATITQAGRHFAPNANPGTVLAAGADAAKAWENLDAARNTMIQIRNARTMIADAERDNIPKYLHYIEPTNDLARINHAEALFQSMGDPFHQLTYAGHKLRLNTAAEAKAMLTKATSAAHGAAQKAEDAARAARIADPHSEVNIRKALASA